MQSQKAEIRTMPLLPRLFEKSVLWHRCCHQLEEIGDPFGRWTFEMRKADILSCKSTLTHLRCTAKFRQIRLTIIKRQPSNVHCKLIWKCKAGEQSEGSVMSE